MAIAMVRSGQISKKSAIKTYGVPTLLDKLMGRVPEEDVRPGRKPVLTAAEEGKVVDFANTLCNFGYPVTKRELLNEVKFVLDHDGRVTPFKDNRPGKDWFSAFMGSHSDMTFRKPMSL